MFHSYRLHKHVDLEEIKKNKKSQKTQNSQTSQVMQNSQKSTQKLTYVQKAAQVTSANANANMNANAGEWNRIIKKFSPKSQEISYHEKRLIVNLKNENWTLKTMKMRDSMNNALKKAKIDLIVITIVKTQHCSDDLEKIHRKHLTSTKCNMKACFWC